MKEKTKPLPWAPPEPPAFQVERRKHDLPETSTPLKNDDHTKPASIEAKAERTGKQRQDSDYDLKPALQKQARPQKSSRQKKKR